MAKQSDDLDFLEIAIAGEMAAADRRIIESWRLPVPTEIDYEWGDFGTEQDIQIACELFASSIAIVFLATVPIHLLLAPPPLNTNGLSPVIEFGKPGGDNNISFFMPTIHIKPTKNLELYYQTMLRFRLIYDFARQLLVSGLGMSQSVQIRHAVDWLIAKRPLAVAECGMQFCVAQDSMTREMVRYALQDDSGVRVESVMAQSSELRIDGNIVDQTSAIIEIPAPDQIMHVSDVNSIDGIQGEQYIFRKYGLHWAVRYQSIENQMYPDLHGMSYIHYLLTNPHKAIRSDNLFHAVRGIIAVEPDLIPSVESVIDNDTEEDIQINITDISKPDDDDQETIAQYREWYRELEKEEARAKRNNNTVELADIQKRKQDLTKFINSKFGIGGKRRSQTDPYKKSRQSVAKAVKTAIKYIRCVNRPLAEHFDDTITTGTDCRYSPQSDISWII